MSQFACVLSVEESEVGVRLDTFISARLASLTRSSVQKLIERESILVNDASTNKNYRVRLDDCVTVRIPQAVPVQAQAEAIPLCIVFEDDDLLVVNKPKGMVVHPAPGNYEGTLVNALLYHCGDSLSGINGMIRPGIVHRIDKDTSGLLIVAKNDFSHTYLAAQIQAHSFTRAYEAVVYGNVKEESGTVDAPIGRHPTQRKQMGVTTRNSRNAITHFQVLERMKGFTHIRAELETGRTHQIRVHLAYIGHPVAGDAIYGPKKVITQLHGQCLHAKQIGFIHPRSGAYMEFESELPAYFKEFLKKL